MKELIIIGGANGSGKTTFSKQILEETNFDFLNADEIERELGVSKVQAGKEFFTRLEELIRIEKNFVLESTLSGNYLVKVISNAIENGYVIKIVYVFLDSPTQCIQRIKLRVSLGGHFVPDEDVIRRFYRSRNNFWNIYKDLASEWIIFYNSTTENSQKVAFGEYSNYSIENIDLFNNFLKNF